MRGRAFRWTVLILLSVVLALIVAVTYAVSRDVILHNRKLNRMFASLKLLEHPADTEHVLDRKNVGLLIGNGNHCDYFVAELRKYNGDREVVLEWYEDETITGPNRKDFDVRVLFLSEGAFVGDKPMLPYDHDLPDDWLDEVNDPDGDYYLVYVFLGAFEEPGLDPRCH
jgi:hypothetical protein